MINALAGVADQEILLITAAERYSVLRRRSPRFLAAFRFHSGTAHDPLLAAIELPKAAAGGAHPMVLPLSRHRS